MRYTKLLWICHDPTNHELICKSQYQTNYVMHSSSHPIEEEAYSPFRKWSPLKRPRHWIRVRALALQPWMYQFIRIQARLRLLRQVVVEGQVEWNWEVYMEFKFEAHFVLGCDRSVITAMGIRRSSSDFGKGKEKYWKILYQTILRQTSQTCGVVVLYEKCLQGPYQYR